MQLHVLDVCIAIICPPIGSTKINKAEKAKERQIMNAENLNMKYALKLESKTCQLQRSYSICRKCGNSTINIFTCPCLIKL
jgi:hypothetical protein